MGRGVIDQIESGEVYSLIKAHCTRTSDGAVYEEGWNDQRVLEERLAAGGVLTLYNVTSLRERACGPIVKKPTSEIALLLQRVKKLEEDNTLFHARISKLEEPVAGG